MFGLVFLIIGFNSILFNQASISNQTTIMNQTTMMKQTTISNDNQPFSSIVDHTRIEISRNSELDAFCSGNGTTGQSWETAHIIGNFSIDTYDEQLNCFTIENTDRFLILRNITLRTYRAFLLSGLKLMNVTHIRLENITVLDGDYAVNFNEVHDCTIVNSSLKAYAYGLYSTFSSDIYIENTISDNLYNQYGIYFLGSSNITLNSCAIYGKREVLTFDDSTQFIVINCTFRSDDAAVFDISGGSGGRIINNTLETSFYTPARLIEFQNHPNFLLESNNFLASQLGPVSISDCDNGRILNNNFSVAGIQLSGENHNLTAPQSNLIQGKPLMYYENLTGVSEIGVEFGQVIINFVNDSIFSHFTVHNSGYSGIQLIQCHNVTLDQCATYSTDTFGISIYDSVQFNINNCTTSGSSYGLSMYNCQFGTIQDSSIFGLSESSGVALYAFSRDITMSLFTAPLISAV